MGKKEKKKNGKNDRRASRKQREDILKPRKPSNRCDWFEKHINRQLEGERNHKQNFLEHCDPKTPAKCPCDSGDKCEPVRLPTIKPCVSIAWGDSECDCFETDDVEVAFVTVCNCYSNVAFRNVRISAIAVEGPDGNWVIDDLPDGTPSVEVIPLGPICFGDLGPCVPGELNCVSREIVVRTRGAASGDYKIRVVGICFDVVLHQDHEECFTLTLCED